MYEPRIPDTHGLQLILHNILLLPHPMWLQSVFKKFQSLYHFKFSFWILNLYLYLQENHLQFLIQQFTLHGIQSNTQMYWFLLLTSIDSRFHFWLLLWFGPLSLPAWIRQQLSKLFSSLVILNFSIQFSFTSAILITSLLSWKYFCGLW